MNVHRSPPRPDVFAESRDHTLRAAFTKAMAQLREQITNRTPRSGCNGSRAISPAAAGEIQQPTIINNQLTPSHESKIILKSLADLPANTVSPRCRRPERALNLSRQLLAPPARATRREIRLARQRSAKFMRELCAASAPFQSARPWPHAGMSQDPETHESTRNKFSWSGIFLPG